MPYGNRGPRSKRSGGKWAAHVKFGRAELGRDAARHGDAVDRSADRCDEDLPAEAAPARAISERDESLTAERRRPMAGRVEAPTSGASIHGSGMNPRLSCLQPYPFERLRALLSGVVFRRCLRSACRSVNRNTRRPTSSARRSSITWRVSPSIRRPRDSTRCARRWRRGSAADSACLGSIRPQRCCRSTARARRCSRLRRRSIDPSRPAPLVVCPNPFYQIYEGAALLAGAEPTFLNQTAAQRLRPRSATRSPRTSGAGRSCSTSARRAIRRAAC